MSVIHSQQIVNLSLITSSYSHSSSVSFPVVIPLLSLLSFFLSSISLPSLSPLSLTLYSGLIVTNLSVCLCVCAGVVYVRVCLCVCLCMCVCVYMCVFLLKVRRGIFISRVIRLGHEYLLTRMRIKLQQGLHLVEGFRAAFWSFLSGKWVCGFF